MSRKKKSWHKKGGCDYLSIIYDLIVFRICIPQDGSHQNLLGTRILNQKVTVKFQKQDADNSGKLLVGAIFKVVSGEGYEGTLQTYTTSSENPTISLYRIIEVTPPVGYKLDNKSSETGQVVLVSPDGTVSLRGFEQNWNQVWTNFR